MTYIRDGTNLVAYGYLDLMRTYNVADLIAKHRNATHEYELILRGMGDGSGQRVTVLGPTQA